MSLACRGGSSWRGAPGTNFSWALGWFPLSPEKKNMHSQTVRHERNFITKIVLFKNNVSTKMFYKKGTFLAFAEAKLFASFAKSIK
jgi:hypothetical protein